MCLALEAIASVGQQRTVSGVRYHSAGSSSTTSGYCKKYRYGLIGLSFVDVCLVLSSSDVYGSFILVSKLAVMSFKPHILLFVDSNSWGD